MIDTTATMGHGAQAHLEPSEVPAREQRMARNGGTEAITTAARKPTRRRRQVPPSQVSRLADRWAPSVQLLDEAHTLLRVNRTTVLEADEFPSDRWFNLLGGLEKRYLATGKPVNRAVNDWQARLDASGRAHSVSVEISRRVVGDSRSALALQVWLSKVYKPTLRSLRISPHNRGFRVLVSYVDTSTASRIFRSLNRSDADLVQSLVEHHLSTEAHRLLACIEQMRQKGAYLPASVTAEVDALCAAVHRNMVTEPAATEALMALDAHIAIAIEAQMHQH